LLLKRMKFRIHSFNPMGKLRSNIKTWWFYLKVIPYYGKSFGLEYAMFGSGKHMMSIRMRRVTKLKNKIGGGLRSGKLGWNNTRRRDKSR